MFCVLLWVVLSLLSPPASTLAITSKPFQFDVDVVYTWVNGSDSAWLKQRKQYEIPRGSPWDANIELRFRSYDELKYSLRSMRDHAPWVRRVYVVTCCKQTPSWLLENEKIQIVDHAVIFPSHLYRPPTYNSFAIETWVHRIPGLAEQFLLMNDDFFFGAPVQKSDFFDEDGRPRIAFQEDWGVNTVPSPSKDDAYLWAAHNCDVLLDNAFRAEPRFKVLHQAYPVTKSLYNRAHSLFGQQLVETARHTFRERSDLIPHFLAEWIGIYEGQAIRLRKDDFPSNKYIRLENASEDNRKQLLNLLAKSGEYKLFCIGDHITTSNAFDVTSSDMHDFFEAYFGPKAPWEK